MFLTAYTKIMTLQTERDSSNKGAHSSYPEIVPHQNCDIRPRDFFQIIKKHNERLYFTCTSPYSIKLEHMFQAFKNQIHNFPSALI